MPDLGFPEFESSHLVDFSIKAQLSKSAASTIPPHPPDKFGSHLFCGGIKQPPDLFQHQMHFLSNFALYNLEKQRFLSKTRLLGFPFAPDVLILHLYRCFLKDFSDVFDSTDCLL
ncbi:hypothetical protein DP117_09835 [Brasilonema sp. UFV-L1]|nr:hypothetical protein [Brasilonema sp. UFV-L1]